MRKIVKGKVDKSKVKEIDPAMSDRKIVKKALVKEMISLDKSKVGGGWSYNGFGTNPEPVSYVKEQGKTDYKAELPRHPEGDFPLAFVEQESHPVKQPTLDHVDAKGYLGNVSSDEVIKNGYSKK